jgi:hypothetical protein
MVQPSRLSEDSAQRLLESTEVETGCLPRALPDLRRIRVLVYGIMGFAVPLRPFYVCTYGTLRFSTIALALRTEVHSAPTMILGYAPETRHRTSVFAFLWSPTGSL